MLNHATSSIAGLNESIITGVIDERVHDAYVTILSAITMICQNQIGTPVRLSCTDMTIPCLMAADSLAGLGRCLAHGFEPGFRRKGYATMTVRKQIIISLIDRFNVMLKRLAGQAPFAHVRYLDLRKTLSCGNDYKDDWANELHPSKAGFEDVAKKFAAVV